MTAALANAQHHSASQGVSTATQTEAPVIEYVVPAPVVTHAAPTQVFEYVTPAPVIEYIAPAPAMTYAAPSEQLHPAYTMTAVTTDVNFDITGLVNPQFSITAVEASAPKVDGSLPPLKKFDAPVYNQVHQEQIVAGETTQNVVENQSVQEQVIVQKIPQVSIVEKMQEDTVEPIEVLPPERVP